MLQRYALSFYAGCIRENRVHFAGSGEPSGRFAINLPETVSPKILTSKLLKSKQQEKSRPKNYF